MIKMMDMSFTHFFFLLSFPVLSVKIDLISTEILFL